MIYPVKSVVNCGLLFVKQRTETLYKKMKIPVFSVQECFWSVNIEWSHLCKSETIRYKKTVAAKVSN